MVSDSGDPIVSLTTDRKLLAPITTAIAVGKQHESARGARTDRDQPPVRQLRREYGVGQPVDAEDDADHGEQRTEKCPDIATQYAEIIEEKERRDKERAKRHGRQKRRPESDRQTAEIRRLISAVGSASKTLPNIRRPPKSSTAAATSAKKAARKNGLELELDDEFQPGRDGPVETRIFVMHVFKEFAVEGIRERVALGQQVAEQLAAHQADLLDQVVDADGKRFRLADDGVDLGFLRRQRLPLAGYDVWFALAFGRRRSNLLQAFVYRRQARPEGGRARKQLPREILQMKPDFDELRILVAVGSDPFFKLVRLPGQTFNGLTLLVDNAVACSARRRAERPEGRRDEQH